MSALNNNIPIFSIYSGFLSHVRVMEKKDDSFWVIPVQLNVVSNMCKMFTLLTQKITIEHKYLTMYLKSFVWLSVSSVSKIITNKKGDRIESPWQWNSFP